MLKKQNSPNVRSMLYGAMAVTSNSVFRKTRHWKDGEQGIPRSGPSTIIIQRPWCICQETGHVRVSGSVGSGTALERKKGGNLARLTREEGGKTAIYEPQLRHLILLTWTRLNSQNLYCGNYRRLRFCDLRTLQGLPRDLIQCSCAVGPVLRGQEHVYTGTAMGAHHWCQIL